MATKAKPGKKATASANGVPAAPSPLDVLTLAEAAAYLRLTAEAVRAEAAAGRIPGRRLGRDWRFLRGGIAQWLSSPTAPRRSSILDVRIPEETPEEIAAFRASIEAYRDEVDRATGSGKYAPK